MSKSQNCRERAREKISESPILLRRRLLLLPYSWLECRAQWYIDIWYENLSKCIYYLHYRKCAPVGQSDIISNFPTSGSRDFRKLYSSRKYIYILRINKIPQTTIGYELDLMVAVFGILSAFPNNFTLSEQPKRKSFAPGNYM